MEKINKETVDLILSEKYNENFWLFELGRTEQIISDSPPIEHQFMNSFFEKGEQLWAKHKEKIKDYLCDKEKSEPKQFAKNLTNETLIELVHRIIELLTNTHNIGEAIAIPLCGLALKKGVHALCK